MTILFAGGEDADFTTVGGGCAVDTGTSAAFRAANARCALKLTPTSGTDGWVGKLSAPSSAFWITARLYASNAGTCGAYGHLVALTDGPTRRIVITTDSVNSSTSHYVLAKINAAGTQTVLATSSIYTVAGGKLDMHVTYAVAGAIDVYLGGTLIMSYTGDVTSDSATTLDGFVLGAHFTLLYSIWWSEAIAATVDTRTLGLVTLAPNGAGNANTFSTGAYTDVNEVTLSDATVATSTTANQIFETTIDSTNMAGVGTLVGVVVKARTQAGPTGPAHTSLMVRVAGTDYLGASQALPGSLAPVMTVWATNPATSAAWVGSDLTAAGFNIGVKSLT